MGKIFLSGRWEKMCTWRNKSQKEIRENKTNKFRIQKEKKILKIYNTVDTKIPKQY